MDNEDSATSTGTAVAAAVEKHELRSERESTPPTAPLSEQEKDIIDRQLTAPNVSIGYFSLFRYASATDKLIMVVALISSIAAGAVMPLMTLVYGNFAGSFTSFSVDASAAARFQHQINTYTLYFIYLVGIGAFVTSYISIIGFSYTGERTTRVIRELYLRAIFRQNIAFFDFLGSGEITTRISSDMNLVQDGIGQKIGLFVTGVSMFVSALIIGFIRSWKLSLIMLAATLALILMMGVNGTFMKKAQTLSIDEYATAASLAEEVLSSARNVAAFGTQKRLAEKYRAFVERATAFDYRAKFWLSMMIAGMMAVLNLQYALAFWQGKRFLDAGELGVSNILTVVMALMIAGFSIGQNLPHIQAFGGATAAATKVFNTIERNSPIDPETDAGIVPDDFIGNLEFRNLKHVYPSRPDTVVLSDFNLDVPSGKMIALVGASGSGKSTIVGLLERFYLPMEGQIYLDGKDITTLNLRWLRQHMAIVSQEPVLFSTTIYESILHGLVNTEYASVSDEKKMELIENAAKIANAHDFIMDLPDKYQTKVGERGGLLSGGQKQRIAIARAIVSDPKILLLDEATAALDTRSESAVQEALDRASQGRTTIVIAHRLSTIKKADNIVVMALGRIVEQGTHQDLINANGVYASLVQAQELTSKISPANRESRMSGFQESEKDEVNEEKLILMRTTTSAPTEFVNKDDKEKEYGTWELIKFAWEMNNGEHMTMTIGLIASFFAGCNPAIQAILLANSINSLLSPGTSLGGHGTNFWCWMFLMLGLVIGFFYYIQGMTLSKGSAKLVGSVRQRAFGAMLRQDMEFFDGDTVTSGALSNFLSSEANRLAGLSGSTLGTIVSAASSILVAFIVGCSFGWKLALVCSSTIPLVIGCGYFRFYALVRMEKRTKETSDAASFACEAASSIRTEYTVLQFYVVYSAIINGAQSAGAIFSFAPDMGEARDAAKILKSFMNRIPKIDHWSPEGKKVDRLEGHVELQGVRFAYPGRPDHRVLRGVSLSAQPGQLIALVGASGSGKSTVMQMLERFYDPTDGSVRVDGVELTDYNLQDYRSQLAMVSQETTLYTGTIRENILANKEDLGDDAVIQACKDANIYEFITSLPDGFNTLVGAKGALLSGGQRQRIAIARALLRDPKVLLLDEATSALDSTSERVVQAALDSASKGRTTIAIAHRLSTIQHADVIYVFDQGKIVEQGTHDDLVEKKGVYFELARLQAIGAPQ
ncbi:multidrug resistance [Pyrenophora seminiperda CCB06]|uniref:Multidrug resistance n=1 Tax=Pyrenophora seminiperda CCB06 TaxID=1302712 RepID=A0A3M7LZD2_9PLEO|nr:multidrug resistance [Pyrenophora seminiperda CCB06]